MTNQLMLSQVRLVYEYLCDEATRCKGKSAPLSLLSHQHVLETARNGLFMIIRATLGEGYDEEKKTYPEGVPLAAMPKEAREICEEFDKKAGEAASEVFAAEDKKVAEKIDLKDVVETAVDIQRREVFSIAKYHPEVREDYRKTNDWYGADTIARNTAIVRFDPPSGDYMEFKKKLFEAFGLFYRKYASPAYDICTKVIVLEHGGIGVMLHAIFNMDFKISDEDLAVVEDCGMAHLLQEGSDEKRKKAEIFGYPVSDWTRVLDEHAIDCPGLLAARLNGFDGYLKLLRRHGIKNGLTELDDRLFTCEEKQSEYKK